MYSLNCLNEPQDRGWWHFFSATAFSRICSLIKVFLWNMLPFFFLPKKKIFAKRWKHFLLPNFISAISKSLISKVSIKYFCPVKWSKSWQLSGLECIVATPASHLKVRGFKQIPRKCLEMLQWPKELQIYFIISFLKTIFWLSFQMSVFGIGSVIELLTILTFLISAIRFQSKPLNCCYFQQVYLAALLVHWSQVLIADKQ